MTAVPSATILTPAQIAYYAQTAGFNGNDLSIAVAIALAESGGNPNVYNPETAAGTPAGQGSYGLWQIYLKEHPEFAADNLYDPQTNANDTYEIYTKDGGSFREWATYTEGTYQAYMGVAAPATPGAVPGLMLDAATPGAAPAFSINEFLWIGAALLAGWALFSFLD